MFISDTKVRILYAHTDKMGVVYYGNYFVFFEAGRNDMLRILGMPYTEIESLGYIIPVLKSHCEYFTPAKYDQLINIRCFLKEMPAARMRIDYEVTFEGEKIATGYTEHCFANMHTFKPSRPPEKFTELLKKYYK